MLIGADFFLSHRVYVDNQRHRLFFTYNGGPVFDLKTKLPGPNGETDAPAAPPLASGTPAAVPAAGATMTAEEFARRGAAETSRRDFAAGLADLDKADGAGEGQCGLRLSARGRAHGQRARGGGADRSRSRADAAAGVVDALMLRATLRYRAQDRAGARAPTWTRCRRRSRNRRMSDSTSPTGTDRLNAQAAQIEQLDQWIPAHPDDSRLPEALNARCWARTLANVAIDDAIAGLQPVAASAPPYRRHDRFARAGLSAPRRSGTVR